jgi:AraC-like DNA-binding protein
MPLTVIPALSFDAILAAERGPTPRHPLWLLTPGAGCEIPPEADYGSLWIPLRGRLSVRDADTHLLLPPRQCLVVEASAGLVVSTTGIEGAVLVLVVPSRTLAAAAEDMFGVSTEHEFALLPQVLDGTDALIDIGAALAGQAASTPIDERMLATAAARALEHLLRAQQGTGALLRRCTGRTEAHRRHVFARLERSRWFMRFNRGDTTISAVARVAHMSTWHYIRVFSAVYGETPHKYLARQRYGHAYRLLSEERLNVGEVIRRLGFVNRCSFARGFQALFGVTPSSVARRAGSVRAAPRLGRMPIDTPAAASTNDADGARGVAIAS